jgi:triosephosphate isomerase
MPRKGNRRNERTPLVAGNWKMNLTTVEAVAHLTDLRTLLESKPSIGAVEVVVCPPFTLLSAASQALAGSRILLGAQDLFWEASGAFTGEISAKQLRDVGCRLVIVGHSERRQLLGETDEEVGKKAAAAVAGGLTPIICVGETLAERQGGETATVVLRQVTRALAGIAKPDLANVIIAYEPVWAIGTGVNAAPAQADEVHAILRRQLAKLGKAGTAASVRILYGGSVKPDNAASLLEQADIDGALVGGASLSASDFVSIVEAAIARKPQVG